MTYGEHMAVTTSRNGDGAQTWTPGLRSFADDLAEARARPTATATVPGERLELSAVVGMTKLPEAEPLDLDAPVPEPSPVIEGYAERDAVTMSTAPRGSLKSMVGQGAAAAMVTGETSYLGLAIDVGADELRVMIVDEENPEYLVRSRMRALGVTKPEHMARLRYYNRLGIQVGDPKWNAWLSKQMASFKPDLLIIDGLIAATNLADSNDATAAGNLFRVFKDLAREHFCAVLVLHHERKRQHGAPYDATDATLGSVMLGNLTDIHLSLALPTDEDELAEAKTSTEVGQDTHLRTEATMSWLRVRDDIEPRPILVAAESVKRGRDLRELHLVSSGPAVAPKERKRARYRADVELVLDGHKPGELVHAGDLAAKLDGSITSDQRWTRTRAEAIKLKRLKAAEKSGTFTVLEPEVTDPQEV